MKKSIKSLIGYEMFSQVINNTGNIQILALNKVKALGNGPHTRPTQFF